MDEETTGLPNAIQEPETAQPKSPRRRIAVLSLILALVSIALAVVLWDTSRLARSLAMATQARVKEESTQAGHVDMKDVASEVVVSRSVVVFGPVTGKVSVYFRDGDHYGGVDYFYDLRDGEWVPTESGACNDAECRVRAMKAFGIE